MKKLVMFILMIALLSFAAEGAFAQQKQLTIGYDIMGLNPLFAAMASGAKQAAKKLGVKLIIEDATFNVDKQNQQLANFITQKVSAVLINPVQATTENPTLEKIKAAGIPIVAIDTRPVGFTPTSYVTMNHFQGGYIAGWHIASLVKCKGNYAVIWAVGNEQAAQRVRGFKAGMAELCKTDGYPYDLHEVGAYSGITGPLRETARKITETLLTKYPKGKLSFIFGQTAEWGIGAYLATQAAGRSDVLIVSMDNSADILKILKEKKNLVSTTAYLAPQVGAAAVSTAVKIIKKEPYLPVLQLNFQLDTQNNVQYDPGWTGHYSPSFSDFLYPQQLGVLQTSLAMAASPSTPQSSSANGSVSGGSSSSNTFLILTIILAVVAVVLLILLVSSRRQRRTEE